MSVATFHMIISALLAFAGLAVWIFIEYLFWKEETRSRKEQNQ